MLKNLASVSSFMNILGGAVLVAIFGANALTDPSRHVPIVVLVIGLSMMIQGLYSLGYTHDWWEAWGELPSGALLAGQLISACAGTALLVYGVFYNARSSRGDFEPAPLLAGLMIVVNALLALLLLATSGTLMPRRRMHAGT